LSDPIFTKRGLALFPCSGLEVFFDLIEEKHASVGYSSHRLERLSKT
jgi:hypothetical protein